MLGDKAAVLVIGLVGMAVTAGLALMGKVETAAVTGTMTMGLVNIFLRVSTNEANAKLIDPDGKKSQLQIESNSADVVKEAATTFVHPPNSDKT